MSIEWEASTLPGGLRVITTPQPHAQSVAVAYFAGIGSRGEVPRTNGLSHYLEHMLFKGTERRPTAQHISEAIEGAGGTLNAYTSRELTCYWNNLPFERAETGIDVVADMLLHSTLPSEEINRERTVVQQEIRRAHDNPAQRVSELSALAVFGDQPIGWPVVGSLDTVEAMQRDDFVEHMRRYYTAENSVLSVAGNVTHEQVMAAVDGRFDGLRQAGDAPREAVSPDLPAEHIRIDARDIEQTNLTLSMRALPRLHPDRYALDVLNTVLGRGMSSRLFKEVRERRGLAYSVSSSAQRYLGAGTFSVFAGVTREHQEEALRVIVAELGRTVTETVGEEELGRARDFLAGSMRLGLETPMALGQRHGNQLLFDGEIEPVDDAVAAIRAVTAADVQRVAQEVIGPGRFALAVVGPSAGEDALDAILAG